MVLVSLPLCDRENNVPSPLICWVVKELNMFAYIC